MNLTNIWTNLNDIPNITHTIGAATARLARVRTLPPFWESNIGPAQNCDVLTPTNWILPSFQPRRAAPFCIASRDFSHGLFDNLNLPRSIHEVIWLSGIHGWRSSLVLITFPASAKTIPSPNPYIIHSFVPFWLHSQQSCTVVKELVPKKRKQLLR